MKTKTIHTATFNRFELEMTLDQAEGASHQGQCDADVAALVQHPEIARQLENIPAEEIREELAEYGAWDDEELADDAQNQHRIVWQAACQIAEEWREVEPAIRALAQHLDCLPSDISEEKYDHYGMTVYSAEGGEYAVATDSEADSACADYVRDSVWAFNASFILSECGLPGELEDAIKAFQSDKCESANEALLSLVEKCSSLESFTEAAISADGRGHFLSPYDGGENEETVNGETYYIYRTN